MTLRTALSGWNCRRTAAAGRQGYVNKKITSATEICDRGDFGWIMSSDE